MATFKVVISDPTTGKSEQKEVTGDAAKALLGKKIGETVKGEPFELPGKTLVVRGGSDYCGFPMRSDLPGTARKRILTTKGIGFRGGLKGIRRRKTVAGNTIHSKIHQINLSIEVEKQKKTKKERKASKAKGKAKPKPAPKKEVKKEEKPAEPKKEEKPAEKPEEKKE